MPIYAVSKPEGATRIINAKSEAAALHFVARGEFTITTVRKPSELADLVQKGIAIESVAQTEAEAENGST